MPNSLENKIKKAQAELDAAFGFGSFRIEILNGKITLGFGDPCKWPLSLAPKNPAKNPEFKKFIKAIYKQLMMSCGVVMLANIDALKSAQQTSNIRGALSDCIPTTISVNADEASLNALVHTTVAMLYTLELQKLKSFTIEKSSRNETPVIKDETLADQDGKVTKRAVNYYEATEHPFSCIYNVFQSDKPQTTEAKAKNIASLIAVNKAIEAFDAYQANNTKKTTRTAEQAIIQMLDTAKREMGSPRMHKLAIAMMIFGSALICIGGFVALAGAAIIPSVVFAPAGVASIAAGSVIGGIGLGLCSAGLFAVRKHADAHCAVASEMRRFGATLKSKIQPLH